MNQICKYNLGKFYKHWVKKIAEQYLLFIINVNLKIYISVKSIFMYIHGGGQSIRTWMGRMKNWRVVNGEGNRIEGSTGGTFTVYVVFSSKKTDQI